jgi:thiosulfate/3-mercaptopyruvate sulfurtransferase
MFSTLISAQELALLVQNETLEQTKKLVMIDCRHDLADTEAGCKAFQQGHLPGAIFTHLDQQLSGAKLTKSGAFRGRHPLPEREQWLQQVRAWGISNATQVVAYDAQGGMFAARLWWLLRWLGHPAVAVLDGGLPAWVALNLPINHTESAISANSLFQAGESLVGQCNFEHILQNLTSKSRLLIDARAPDRYRGENETIDPVGGHIPGAKNRFFKDNLQADGRFKSAAQLREEWQARIADPAQTIMQCGSGVTACHNLLALEVAGMPGAVLYPGSWSEWCADPSRPVVQGVE